MRLNEMARGGDGDAEAGAGVAFSGAPPTRARSTSATAPMSFRIAAEPVKAPMPAGTTDTLDDVAIGSDPSCYCLS